MPGMKFYRTDRVTVFVEATEYDNDPAVEARPITVLMALGPRGAESELTISTDREFVDGIEPGPIVRLLPADSWLFKLNFVDCHPVDVDEEVRAALERSEQITP